LVECCFVSCIGYLTTSNSWTNTQPTDWVYKKHELVFSLKGREIEMVSGNSALQYSKKINLVLIWNGFSDASDILVKYLSSSKPFDTAVDKVM
jgi:hypothetical protein